MAQIPVHADLLTQQFPYNFTELSSTILTTQGSIEQDAQREQAPGFPQTYYMENVLPISRGYSSVGFTEKVPENEDIGRITSSFVIYGTEGNVALFVADTKAAWVYDPNGGEWIELELPAIGLEFVTKATVQEQTYIHLGSALFRYNFNRQELEKVNLEGFPGVGETLGVCSAAGQLVLWNSTDLYYGSTVEVLDFTPSVDTGAGTTKVQQLRGDIIACVTLGRDFIIYSKISAVSARATDSLSFPFRFKEISGSSGVSNINHIAFNSNSGLHLTWTASGFQQVTVEEAQYVWPELSTGIIKGTVHRRDEIFQIPELEHIGQLEVTLNFVSNRFVAISVRALRGNGGEDDSNFYDCYILDTILGRWGKLNVPHAGFLEYVVPEVFEPYTYDDLANDYATYGEMESTGFSYSGLLPINSIEIEELGSNLGILLPNGSVQALSYWETADFRATNGSDFDATEPRIFLGKYKINRSRGVMLQWVKLKKLYDAGIYIYGHLYEGGFARVKKMEFENPKHPGQWFGRLAADSISLELRGQFKLTDLTLSLADSGQVNQLSNMLESTLAMTTEVFQEPEYEYATSWLYKPHTMDNVTGGAEISSGFSRQDQPFFTEETTTSASITGTFVKESVIQETDVGSDEVTTSANITGDFEKVQVLHTTDIERENIQPSADITGDFVKELVVIEHDIETEDMTCSAEITGTFELETA